MYVILCQLIEGDSSVLLVRASGTTMGCHQELADPSVKNRKIRARGFTKIRNSSLKKSKYTKKGQKLKKKNKIDRIDKTE